MIPLVFLLISVIGGASAPLVKYAVSQFPPITLVFLRATLCALIILPFVLKEKPKFTDKRLYFAGILFAANWILFAFGIQRSSIIMSQALYIPAPIIVAILGFIFLKEKLSKNHVIGLFLSLVGISLLLFESVGAQDIVSFGTPFGNLLVTCAVLTWSLYLIVSRRISKDYSPLTIIFYNFITSFFASLLLLPFERSIGHFQIEFTTEGILGLVSLALFSSVIVFYLIQWLIKQTSAFLPSLTLYLTAIFGGFAGIIFYGERLSAYFIVGAILIFSGVFIATAVSHLHERFKIKLWIFQ